VNEFVGPYQVQLPEGTWYDFWTGKQVQGTSLMVDPPLDNLPVYIRGGAILPEQPLVQNVDEVPRGPLDVLAYPGPDCRGSLYQDDGNTLAYTRGEYLRVDFTCDARPDFLRLQYSLSHAAYKPWWTAMRVVFFGITSAPRQLSVNGQNMTNWLFDPSAQSVTVTIPFSNSGSEIMLQR
jgi:alpha-glucosidase